MKLFYFLRSDKIENFGDSLNPWLWEKLIKDELDEDETTAFIGIGTIINGLLPQRVPNARNFVIFSSGVGYESNTIPPINEHWTIYCVRGPLSAQKLGLPATKSVADGALLLRRVYQAAEPKDYQFSFLPHVEEAILKEELWRDACEQAGIRYIDPRWSIERVLSLISRTEILLAEAMHGAIAAEALRVPWIPIVSSSRILRFKWLDWCTSLNLNYQPAQILPLVPCSSQFHPRQSPENWLDEQRQIESCFPELLAAQLLEITKTFEPNLSKDCHLEGLVAELEARLFQFKSDVQAGKYQCSKKFL